MENIVVKDLTPDEAWQLAQLAKRITYAHFLDLVPPHSKEDADIMRDAVVKLGAALQESGFSPR